MTAGLRLKVDPIACQGRGLCAELLPGLITLDDWGFPLVSGQDVPAALRAAASAAVQLCPRLALRLEPAAAATGGRPRRDH
jgi:ferredoxin